MTTTEDTSNLTVPELEARIAALRSQMSAKSQAEVEQEILKLHATMEFLRRLLPVVLRNEDKVWLDVEGLFKLSRAHGIYLEVGPQRMGQEHMDVLLREYFSQRRGFQTGGLQVLGYSLNMTDKPKFMLRFCKLPAPSSSPNNTTT